ncbi:MAG: DUF2085 domain-containing protein [Polyangiaceae bacterium]
MTPATFADSRARTRAKIVAWLRGALVFSGVLPWVLPFARARLPLGQIGVQLDLVFFSMCHRRAARTLVFEGVAMPLCSRCAGIFLGVAIAAVIARPIVTLKTWRALFAVACALMLTDVVTQDLGIHPVWHATRIASGLLVGYLMVIGFLSGLARDAEVDAAGAANTAKSTLPPPAAPSP